MCRENLLMSVVSVHVKVGILLKSMTMDLPSADGPPTERQRNLSATVVRSMTLLMRRETDEDSRRKTEKMSTFWSPHRDRWTSADPGPKELAKCGPVPLSLRRIGEGS